MRHVHHKTSGDYTKVITAANQVMEPSNFIETVIHKPLVK